MLSSVQKEPQPEINPVLWWTLIKHFAANDSLPPFQAVQAPMSAGYVRDSPEE